MYRRSRARYSAGCNGVWELHLDAFAWRMARSTGGGWQNSPVAVGRSRSLGGGYSVGHKGGWNCRTLSPLCVRLEIALRDSNKPPIFLRQKSPYGMQFFGYGTHFLPFLTPLVRPQRGRSKRCFSTLLTFRFLLLLSRTPCGGVLFQK